MAARRRRSKDRSPQGPPSQATRRRSSLSVRQVEGGTWELVHPPCARDRADDLGEVQRMIDAGELDVARDELVWLLEDCRDFLAAHRLLAEIALEAGDVRLARAHFGYAWQIGEGALPPGRVAGPLPYARSANQAFLESGKGLAWCLIQLGKPDEARPILDQLIAFDPADPLGTKALATP